MRIADSSTALSFGYILANVLIASDHIWTVKQDGSGRGTVRFRYYSDYVHALQCCTDALFLLLVFCFAVFVTIFQTLFAVRFSLCTSLMSQHLGRAIASMLVALTSIDFSFASYLSLFAYHLLYFYLFSLYFRRFAVYFSCITHSHTENRFQTLWILYSQFLPDVSNAPSITYFAYKYTLTHERQITNPSTFCRQWWWFTRSIGWLLLLPIKRHLRLFFTSSFCYPWISFHPVSPVINPLTILNFRSNDYLAHTLHVNQSLLQLLRFFSRSNNDHLFKHR